MPDINVVELIGYVASALVVLALTMSSVVRLRIISFCGAVTFLTYGVLIGSVPIIITNASIACINVWHLRKEFMSGGRGGIDLGASHIRVDSPFLADFVASHLDDIRHFQPDFHMPTGDNAVAWLFTRDGLPAGLVAGRRDGDVLTIDVDYVMAAYRDSRLGRWLYGPGADVFRRDGLTRLQTTGMTETHCRYLERIGFRPSVEHPTMLELRL